MTHRMWIGISIAGMLWLSWMMGSPSAQAVGLAPTAPAADSFGYAPEAYSYAWVEINGELPLSNVDQDGEFSGPYALGFSFPFYENNYDKLYVSGSGVLTFEEGVFSPENVMLPRSLSPNNMIAPFWSWLELNYGNVYIKTDLVSNPKRTIIEWDQVGPPGGQFSYQAILFADGNIVFQYKTLPVMLGNYSVGIEDGDGAVGLTAAYNTPGSLTPGSAMLLRRPSNGARLKALPTMQGKYFSRGAAGFRVALKNTGFPASDRFDLTIGADQPGWQVGFQDVQTGGQLTDTNSNGVVDSGLVAAGVTKAIRVNITVPEDTEEGVYGTVVLTATSSLDPTKYFTITLQAAVPVQFAQVYKKLKEVRVAQIWEVNSIDRPANDLYNGPTMGVEAITIDDNIVFWEQTYLYETRSYNDIEYRLFNRLSGAGNTRVLSNGLKVMQEEPGLIFVDAHRPSVAVNSSGSIAFAYSQIKARAVSARAGKTNLAPKYATETNTNIYLNLLDPETRLPLLPEALNITGDSSWYGLSSTITHNNAMTAITSDDRYVVCWIRTTASVIGENSDTIFCSFYTYNPVRQRMDLVQGPVAVRVDSDPWLLQNMSLVSLSDARVLLSYARLNKDTNQSHIEYLIRNSDGTINLGPQVVSGAQGNQPRPLVFGAISDGDVMISWLDSNERVGYTYLDHGNDYAAYAGFPRYLESPNQRRATALSATLETEGRAVLTWLDGDQYAFLYSAVLDPAQNVVTPPMIFMASDIAAGEPVLVTNSYGYGNASYQGVYQLFMPLTRR